MTDSTRLTLCDSSEVSTDMPVRCERNGVAYAVFVLEDDYFVLSDMCSHGPGSLSQGYVEGCEVECPFHQGRFDIRTGQPTAPPCSQPVRSWTAHVVAGRIEIDPGEITRMANARETQG
ncbi:aromatic hydrocarbons catabolism-related dioxygenase [Caballeronia udeis]|uniref:Aromatic hydrocarbons catabolism-related dioxygenase n=1 Tax=Caballeronia udeis TaxID=1232866 RepID=A0A158J3L1_9BURK|nr:non-heme iron oxygenase ferredoxin subunit [Caballeronia udeis]SAL63446.1 aromatic hydrocarbons catabolism-related dioxygenase [Caballeronia udeis]